MKLFVYGSLKTGHSNHQRMMRLGAKLVSDARTIGGTALFILQQDDRVIATMIKDHSSSDSIKGEIYEVSDFSQLDLWEGAPYFYKRMKIKVVNEETGKIEEVETYLFMDTNRVESEGEYIPNGNYREEHFILPLGLVA